MGEDSDSQEKKSDSQLNKGQFLDPNIGIEQEKLRALPSKTNSIFTLQNNSNSKQPSDEDQTIRNSEKQSKKKKDTIVQDQKNLKNFVKNKISKKGSKIKKKSKNQKKAKGTKKKGKLRNSGIGMGMDMVMDFLPL